MLSVLVILYIGDVKQTGLIQPASLPVIRNPFSGWPIYVLKGYFHSSGSMFLKSKYVNSVWQ